jgi:peptidoglycan/LPS O-acetylase OafA/YrhL
MDGPNGGYCAPLGCANIFADNRATRPHACMKRSYRRTLDILTTGMRSSRTRWWFFAVLVSLAAASLHTLPVHAASDDHHTFHEVVLTFSAFILVGLCVASARTSLKKRIGVGSIGASNGIYAIVVSSLTSAVTHGTVLQIYIGGLIAAAGAMFGAFLSIQLRRR